MKEINEEQKINEILKDNFFEKLQHYIFDTNYDECLTNFLKKNNCTVSDINYAIHDPNATKLDYDELAINDFNNFIQNIKNNSDFGFEIFLKKLEILKLLKDFEYYCNNNSNFKLILNGKNIAIDFYNTEIIGNFQQTKIKNLYSEFIEQNQFVNFTKEENLNTLKCKIIFFVLDYTSKYLTSIMHEINEDIIKLFKLYKLEAKYKLNKNTCLSNDILSSIKKLSYSKYNKPIGRRHKTLDIDKNELFFTMEIAKEALNDNKKYINTIIKNKKLNIEQKKKEFANFISNMNYLESNILSIYFNEKLYYDTAEVKFCLYKFIDTEYELKFFDGKNDTHSFENMSKWFKRNFKNL